MRIGEKKAWFRPTANNVRSSSTMYLSYDECIVSTTTTTKKKAISTIQHFREERGQRLRDYKIDIERNLKFEFPANETVARTKCSKMGFIRPNGITLNIL